MILKTPELGPYDPETEFPPELLPLLKFTMTILQMRPRVHSIERKLGWKDPNEPTPVFQEPKTWQECDAIVTEYWPRIVRARKWVDENTVSVIKLNFPTDTQTYPDDHDYWLLMTRCDIAHDEAFYILYCIGDFTSANRTRLGKYLICFDGPNETPLFEYKPPSATEGSSKTNENVEGQPNQERLKRKRVAPSVDDIPRIILGSANKIVKKNVGKPKRGSARSREQRASGENVKEDRE